jgi:molecular chaperone Hsp33
MSKSAKDLLAECPRPIVIDPSSSVRSFVDRTHHAVWAHGHFDRLYQGYEDHAAQLGPLPDDRALSLMGQCLAAANLQLALLPPDQFCSWTLNVMAPQANVFIAGDNNVMQLTGRIFEESVKTEGVNRLFIESQRPRHAPARSVVDFKGTDVNHAFEQYYARSLQTRARMFTLGQDEVVLIQGLPHVERPWLRELPLDEVRQTLAQEELEHIEDRTYVFRCGCDPERMKTVVANLFGSNLDELFGSDDEVDVQCPRCGQQWHIARKDLQP